MQKTLLQKYWFIISLSLTFTLASCGTDEFNATAANPPILDREGNPTSNNQDPQNQNNDPVINDPIPAAPSWRALLFTGDNSINAFDNARKKIYSLLPTDVFEDEDIRQLSMMAREIDNVKVKKTSTATIKAALQELVQKDDDHCFLHMTSHGSRTGFYLVGQREMSPREFSQILDETCGTRPTVLLISACYSGIFVNSPDMAKPNRIILSAARHDRTSFGCSPENEYTYWDGCLIDNLYRSNSWRDLYAKVYSCIETKESRGNFTPSLPQLFVGSQVEDLEYFFNP